MTLGTNFNEVNEIYHFIVISFGQMVGLDSSRMHVYLMVVFVAHKIQGAICMELL